MAPAPELSEPPIEHIKSSFLCNLFWHQEITEEVQPGHFLVTCRRCGEALSVYGSFPFKTFLLEDPAPKPTLKENI